VISKNFKLCAFIHEVSVAVIALPMSKAKAEKGEYFSMKPWRSCQLYMDFIFFAGFEFLSFIFIHITSGDKNPALKFPHINLQNKFTDILTFVNLLLIVFIIAPAIFASNRKAFTVTDINSATLANSSV
jgi:hypothetical protein